MQKSLNLNCIEERFVINLIMYESINASHQHPPSLRQPWDIWLNALFREWGIWLWKRDFYKHKHWTLVRFYQGGGFYQNFAFGWGIWTTNLACGRGIWTKKIRKIKCQGEDVSDSHWLTINSETACASRCATRTHDSAVPNIKQRGQACYFDLIGRFTLYDSVAS
jgi:hypothetical protein